jgi:transcription initiation factor TFIIIB Brf1 subunit/transcription initiation factor TFIIB
MSAFAQRGGGGMGGQSGMGQSGAGGARGGRTGNSEMPRVERQSKLDTITEKLKLNKEQKDQVQTIFLAALEESRPLGEQIMKARDEIAEAMIAGKSEDDIKKMLDEYTGLAAQMTGIETKTFAKVYALLKPNQQPKSPAAFEIMSGMFGAQTGSGSRGRG